MPEYLALARENLIIIFFRDVSVSSCVQTCITHRLETFVERHCRRSSCLVDANLFLIYFILFFSSEDC